MLSGVISHYKSLKIFVFLYSQRITITNKYVHFKKNILKHFRSIN